MSPIRQHNLLLSYHEILAKPDEDSRLAAFSQLITGLPEEEMDYLDRLLTRDLRQAWEKRGWGPIPPVEFTNPV